MLQNNNGNGSEIGTLMLLVLEGKLSLEQVVQLGMKPDFAYQTLCEKHRDLKE